jgi:hypothetical protein
MRRAALMLAVVLALGLIGGVAQAKKARVKVVTEISIEGFTYDLPTDTVTLFGHVSARRPKCIRKRTAKLQQITSDLTAGSNQTDDSGYWEVDFTGVEIPPGEFQVTAEKRRIVKKHKIIRCRAATSLAFLAG